MADRLATLCTSCGLCCDGTLFTQVPVTEVEAGALRARGLELRAGDRPALPQRCAALVGTCCTIYDERPAGCRRYVCMLYAALAEGEVGLDEALGLVAATQGSLAALAAALPPGAGAVMQRARAELRAGTLTPAGQRALGDVARQLGRHFDREAGRGSG